MSPALSGMSPALSGMSPAQSGMSPALSGAASTVSGTARGGAYPSFFASSARTAWASARPPEARTT